MLITSYGVTKFGDNTIIKTDRHSMDMSGCSVNGRIAFIDGGHAEMTYDSEPTVEIFINHGRFVVAQPVIPALLRFKQVAINILDAFRKGFAVS